MSRTCSWNTGRKWWMNSDQTTIQSWKKPLDTLISLWNMLGFCWWFWWWSHAVHHPINLKILSIQRIKPAMQVDSMLLLLEVPVPSRRLKRRIQQRRRLLITLEAYWEINVTKRNMKPSENMLKERRGVLKYKLVPNQFNFNFMVVGQLAVWRPRRYFEYHKPNKI